MSVITAHEAAVRLGLLDKEIDRAALNAARRTVTYWRSLTMTGIRSKGVGRAIFEKKAQGLKVIIKRDRTRQEGDAFLGGLRLRGMAAMQEIGGKTAAHLIVAKRARGGLLGFLGPNGHVITPKSVHHPGSRIPAMPSAGPAQPLVEARAVQELEKGLLAAITKSGLGA